MLVTRTLASFFLDVACLGKSHLGEERTEDLIDQDGEQCNVADNSTIRTKLNSFDRHTECNTCLRKQGDAEIFDDVGIGFCNPCADICTLIFSERACDDVNDTNNYDCPLREYREVQLRAADDEEQD